MARATKADGVAARGDGRTYWHLATSPSEAAFTELEFALMRVHESFGRWQSDCFAAASGLTLSGSENTLLHVIRLHNRAKPLKELARLTNRDDFPNLQYAIRKLIKYRLITQSGSRSNAVYSTTAQGVAATDSYAAFRAKLLAEFAEAVSGLDGRMRQSTQVLNLLSGFYEQASRVAAIERRDADDGS